MIISIYIELRFDTSYLCYPDRLVKKLIKQLTYNKNKQEN